ncbi:helix-turn-helix transcriptional regulator [Nocardia sp. NPDC051787]|uniref:helix-turn-helix domain-containing protein n=1 Tax=Nocardia sp. NPDC051787 TaxID=3155415 RepID=UPI0034240F72
MTLSPLSNDDIGARIRLHRERSGRTQAVIAGLAGISTDYLGQVERGRKTPSAGVLRSLASVLGVPVGILLGDSPAEVPKSVSTSGDRLAFALMSGRGSVVDLGELSDRVQHAWQIWLTSSHRYSELLPVLPELIGDTEATLRGLRRAPQRRQVAVIATDLYGLLRTVTRRVGRTDLSNLVADRGLRAAEDADDPIRVAIARWNLGHTLLMSNEYEAAVELAVVAAEEVVAESGTSAASIALAGALNLVATVAEARAGRHWAARNRLNTVCPLAVHAKDAGNVGHTMFSRFNVGLHSVSIELEAGDSTEALRIADQLDASECLSVERHFTLALDLARAYELRREETGTLLHLLNAERVAPEDLDRNVGAQEMVRRLLHSTRSANRAQAVVLAQRLGIDT